MLQRMRIVRFATRSLNDVAFLRPLRPFVSRSLSTNANEDNFDLFGDYTGTDEKSSSFFQHLGNAQKDKRDSHGFNRPYGSGSGSRYSAGGFMNRNESFDPSSDGVDGKLKEAALLFNIDEGEGMKDSYTLRSDINSLGLDNYPRDINRRRQMQKPRQNIKPEITTKEVLSTADFRNVRFLAQFITEAGIIVKRKQTGISAKAQRKIAREIKTARAFGLMPFTTMGTKAFTFGKTMENKDQDFEYEVLDEDDDFDNETS